MMEGERIQQVYRVTWFVAVGGRLAAAVKVRDKCSKGLSERVSYRQPGFVCV